MKASVRRRRSDASRAGRVLLILINMGLTACRSEAPGKSETTADAAATERQFVETTGDILWSIGGAATDTTLFLPWILAADDERLYVIDKGAYRLLAIDAMTGQVLWSRGRRGSGPGEFRLPTGLTILPDGDVLVADSENAMISRFSPDGELVQAMNLGEVEVSYVESLCALSDGSILLAAMADQQPIVHLDEQGKLIERWELPWRDTRDKPSIVLQKTLVAGPRREFCIMALDLWGGFARVSQQGFLGSHTYVERLDLPEVSVSASGDGATRSQRLVERQIAAIDAAVADGALAIAFEGRSENKGRIVDLYDVETGEYQRSFLSPWWIESLAYAQETYFILHTYNGYPRLSAVKVRLSSNDGGDAPAISE